MILSNNNYIWSYFLHYIYLNYDEEKFVKIIKCEKVVHLNVNKIKKNS